MLSTDQAWERFGREDPYFGVLAEEKFALGRIDSNRDEFFATGRRSVTAILERIEAQFGSVPRGRALDHGCGVGRLTLPLAEQFSEVVGLDVSSSMLAEARSNAERHGARNIHFDLADDRLSKAPGAFDLVNSYMVLQHVPVRRGLSILDRLLGKARPGGAFQIHVSVRTDRLRARALWWASHHIPGVKIWQNVCAGRRWNAPAMQMNNYPLGRIAVLLAAHGISEFLVTTEKHAEFLTCSIIGTMPQGR